MLDMDIVHELGNIYKIQYGYGSRYCTKYGVV